MLYNIVRRAHRTGLVNFFQINFFARFMKIPFEGGLQ